MLVRFLSQNDAVIYHRLRLLGLRESPDAFGSTYEEEVHFPLEKIQSRIPIPGDNFVIGAFLDQDELVGIATFRRETHIKSQHRGNVYGMYVSETARGQGVGKSIMQKLIETAQLLDGLEQIGLDVVLPNDITRNFYLSQGFQVFGCHEKAIKYKGVYHDVELMVRYLK